MKIKKTTAHPDDTDYSGYSRRYKISDFDFKTMEFTRTQRGNALITNEVPIASIILEDFGDSVTIHFGNLCHIHLDFEEFKKFKEGIEYIWGAIKEFENILEISKNTEENKIWTKLEKDQKKLRKQAKDWYEKNKI